MNRRTMRGSTQITPSIVSCKLDSNIVCCLLTAWTQQKCLHHHYLLYLVPHRFIWMKRWQIIKIIIIKHCLLSSFFRSFLCFACLTKEVLPLSWMENLKFSLIVSTNLMTLLSFRSLYYQDWKAFHAKETAPVRNICIYVIGESFYDDDENERSRWKKCCINYFSFFSRSLIYSSTFFSWIFHPENSQSKLEKFLNYHI